MTSTRPTWRTTVSPFLKCFCQRGCSDSDWVVYTSYLDFACDRVWRQRLPGGLCSYEFGLVLCEWLRQRRIWTGQAAHRRWQQMAVQEQGPRWGNPVVCFWHLTLLEKLVNCTYKLLCGGYVLLKLFFSDLRSFLGLQVCWVQQPLWVWSYCGTWTGVSPRLTNISTLQRTTSRFISYLNNLLSMCQGIKKNNWNTFYCLLHK